MGIKEPAHASWKALKASCLETALFLRPTFFVIFFLLFFHSYGGVADGAGSPGPAACVLPGQEEHCPTRGLPQAFPFPRGLLSFVKLIWLQILMALPQSPGGAGCSAVCRGGVRSPEMFTAPIRAARVPLGTGQAQPHRANSSCPGLQ